MVYRKGELSKGAMYRNWPYQVALPAYRCLGHNYLTIRFFCEGEGLSLCRRTHSLRRDDQDLVIFCFAQRQHAEQFRERFDGEFIDPKSRPKRPAARRSRCIRNLLKQEGADPNWVARNIARYVYEGDNGKGNPAYWLTRDAYSMIAMGFKLNNPTVVRWKFAFLDAFNRYEALALEADTRAPAVPKTFAEMQALQETFFRQQEARVIAAERKSALMIEDQNSNANLRKRLDALEISHKEVNENLGKVGRYALKLQSKTAKKPSGGTPTQTPPSCTLF